MKRSDIVRTIQVQFKRMRGTFTARDDAVYVVFYSFGAVTITDYQMEEGSSATPYVPYGNVYIPQNQ